MYAVVFDLELVKRFRKGQLSEIVEIGACKVDLNSANIIDQFQIYILPRCGYLSKSTRKFIKIKKEDEKKAVHFRVGIEKFSKWLGDNYFLCSWGSDDKAHIINQCIRNKIKLDWFKNYNDIQKPIGHLLAKDENSQMGLRNALTQASIDPIGKAHRGIDDAINTAQLLIKYKGEITLAHNIVSKNEIHRQRIKIKQALEQSRALKLNN